MGDASRRVSLGKLEADFVREFEAGERTAAETAYALAFRYRCEDVDGVRRFDLAKLWAERAIDILDSSRSDTLEQVVSTRLNVGGVPLPSLLHSGVVRHRLGDVLV